MKEVVLQSSIAHFPGIGPRKEEELRQAGIHDWDTLLKESSKIFRSQHLRKITIAIEQSIQKLEDRDYHYFAQTLPPAERWRLIPIFYPDITYFDIEATGGSSFPYANSTAICFLHGGELLQEFDYLKKKLLLEKIEAEAKMICSFNGASYDVPFLREEFSTPLAMLHIDLCHWLRSQGFTGGLKAIQYSQVHLRQREFPDVDGYDAVRLWRLHEQGVPDALDALLTYNAEDVLILPQLLVDAFNRELEKRPYLNVQKLTDPVLPSLSTRITWKIYELLRAKTSLATPSAGDFLKLY